MQRKSLINKELGGGARLRVSPELAVNRAIEYAERRWKRPYSTLIRWQKEIIIYTLNYSWGLSPKELAPYLQLSEVTIRQYLNSATYHINKDTKLPINRSYRHYYNRMRLYILLYADYLVID